MRLLAMALAFFATPALSLSCLPADPVRDFKAADTASERWGIAVGRLDFDPSRVPEVDWDHQENVPPQTDLRATFVGKSLGPSGYNTDFQANVTLRVLCFGPWCAAPKSGARYLAFIMHENGKRVVLADPCGSWLYRNPQSYDLDRVHKCLVGGPCEERKF